MKIGKALIVLKSLHTILEEKGDKFYAKALGVLIEESNKKFSKDRQMKNNEIEQETDKIKLKVPKNELDWSGNPFVCEKCKKEDEYPICIKECEGYPYSHVRIKCKHCNNEENFTV